MKTYEIKNDRGFFVGHVKCSRAPAMFGSRTAYTAIAINGRVVGCSRPTLESARALLLK